MRKVSTKEEYYHNDIEYLEDHFRLIDLMEQRQEIIDYAKEGDQSKALMLNELDRQIAHKLQEIQERKSSSSQHRKTFCLDHIIQEHHLDEIESKILILLLYRYFTTDNEGTSGREILEHITQDRLSMMRSRHYLMEDAKLRTHNLISCEEADDEEHSVLDIEFFLPESVISQVLGEKGSIKKKTTRYLTEKTYKNYLNLHFSLVDLLEKKAEISSMLRHDSGSPLNLLEFFTPKENGKEMNRIRYNIRKLKATLEEFGETKATYPLEQVAQEYQLTYEEKLILVILLQDSLGFSDSFGGIEGKKLLAMVSESENEMIARRPLLYKEGKLRKNHLVEMEKGWGGQNILDGEYFLSEKTIRRLLGEGNEHPTLDEECQCNDDEEERTLLVLTPRFSFEDVILNPEKKKSIEIALSQQKHHDLIFKTWGFEKKIPYGNGLTMLFSGLPGTGKTMMAEAIARSLEKKLLIANYAQIQNMYVGETEKRIVATFKKAKDLGGVLLWDEADAMFYSREIASHSWEYRDINVILQELERFQGMVILTTNRTVSLDPALERRIGLKVSFDMPGPEQRKQIWQSLIPGEAPLAPDVNFQELADKYEISGGTIKNAVLHAARYAAYRGSSNITQADLVQGVTMETEASWSTLDKIGFKKP